jgi:hypothetical protein
MYSMGVILFSVLKKAKCAFLGLIIMLLDLMFIHII